MPYKLTPRRQAANFRNLQKAWEASKELGFRFGGPKSQAWRDSGYAPLLYGLYPRNLRGSAIHLREDVREFDRNLRRFARAFVPRDDIERTLVRAIAESAWRLLCVFRTRAAADAKILKHVLASVPRARVLDADETLDLALKPTSALDSDLKALASARRIQRQRERLLGMLVRKRSKGKTDYRIITRVHKDDWKNLLAYTRASCRRKRR